MVCICNQSKNNGRLIVVIVITDTGSKYNWPSFVRDTRKQGIGEGGGGGSNLKIQQNYSSPYSMYGLEGGFQLKNPSKL